MFYNTQNFKKISFTTFVLATLTLGIFFQIPYLQNNLFDLKDNGGHFSEENNLQTSETDYYTKEWIKYGNFSSGWGSYWYNDISGDATDSNALVSNEEAKYQILGDADTFSFTADPPQSSDWEDHLNPDYPAYPDSHGINSDGLWFQHQFTENPLSSDQMASVNWVHEVNLGDNMSDYKITSASMTAIFNGTADSNIECPGDQADYYTTYDWARFYVLLSYKTEVSYEVAYYQVNDLGIGDATQSGPTRYKGDTYMITVPESSLITFLTSVLSYDYVDFNITLGIKVWCEDNRGTEYDDWDYLVINYFDFSFNYEKNIEQLNTISWNQDGDIIPSNYNIENATLNFKYKIDKDWLEYTGSLNSEFRIIINNIQHSETVKFSNGLDTYQDAKSGGFDVASYLTPGEEVNLTIEAYIADKFNLNSTVVISIDNVSLIIGYGIYTEPYETSYDLILNNLDRTTEKSAQVTFNKNLNITLVYKNKTGDEFISGADVEVTGEGLGPIILFPNGFDNYYTVINSSDLGVGITYLTLTASKRYYATVQFQITIEVVNRDTELQLYLDNTNQTIDKEWTTAWNENLNITIKDFIKARQIINSCS